MKAMLQLNDRAEKYRITVQIEYLLQKPIRNCGNNKYQTEIKRLRISPFHLNVAPKVAASSSILRLPPRSSLRHAAPINIRLDQLPRL